VQQPQRSGVGADESDQEVGRQENCAAREHFEMMSTQSKRATRTLGELPNRVNVFSMAKVGRPGLSCSMDCRQ